MDTDGTLRQEGRGVHVQVPNRVRLVQLGQGSFPAPGLCYVRIVDYEGLITVQCNLGAAINGEEIDIWARRVKNGTSMTVWKIP